MKIVLLAALLLASAAAAADVNCSRSELQVAVNAYLEAQKAGDRNLLPTVSATLFYEQQALIEARDSIVNKALAVDFSRSILDEASCQTFTELIVLDEKHPYVIGTRLRLVAGTVMELEAMVTDEGNWWFNPQVAFDHSSTESWDILPSGLAPVPAGERQDPLRPHTDGLPRGWLSVLRLRLANRLSSSTWRDDLRSGIDGLARPDAHGTPIWQSSVDRASDNVN